MSTIITIQGGDNVGESRPDLNTNFANLNADKLENGDNVSELTNDANYVNQTALDGLTLGDIAFAVNAQTGTTYTLIDSDHGKLVTLNNASAITLTVPSGLRSDFYCSISQIGAGLVSIAESGSTVNNFDSHTDLAGQYAMASIIAITAANTFLLQGRTA